MNNFCQHLYDETTDGYIQIVKLDNGRVAKIKNTQINYIKEITEEFVGESDVYVTPNTTYIPFRRVENIRQFRALFLDFDNIEGDKVYVGHMILELADEGKIPRPTMITDSGRGIHVYWKIEHAPYGALYSWQEIEDMLYHRLKHLGADKQATDASRLLRLPNTINSKNDKLCAVMYLDQDLQYSMYDIKEKYIVPNLKKKYKKYNTKKKVTTNAFFNSYSLHMTRAKDIITLCKLRNYNVKGYRNMILHCYAYWIGIYARNEEELRESVEELNNKFVAPLKPSEVNAILRCVPKAIDKFIAYEQGIRNGEDKRISKGMKDKAGYWYKNETLIERLDMTEHEQTFMETIIGTREKYDRNNKRRTPRNENGLTAKQQELTDLKSQVISLKEKGMSIRKIAKELNVTASKVQRVLKD